PGLLMAIRTSCWPAHKSIGRRNTSWSPWSLATAVSSGVSLKHDRPDTDRVAQVVVHMADDGRAPAVADEEDFPGAILQRNDRLDHGADSLIEWHRLPRCVVISIRSRRWENAAR